MKKCVYVIAILASLSACASAGNQILKNETQATLDAKIKIGETTQDQVKTMFGEPSGISFTDAGNQIWTYTYAKGVVQARNFIPVVSLFSSGIDVDKKTVVILFDADKKVKNFSVQNSKEVQKSGLVPQ